MQQEKIIAIIFTVAAMLFSAVTYSYAHPTTLYRSEPVQQGYELPPTTLGPGVGEGFTPPAPQQLAPVPENPNPRSLNPALEPKIRAPRVEAAPAPPTVDRVVYRAVPFTVRATSYGYRYHAPMVVHVLYEVVP